MHRGPQAHATPQSQAVIPSYGGYAPQFHAPNAALLIDFDNVTMGIRSDLGNELRNLLGSDIIKGKVAVQRAYADWRRYPQYIVPLTESSIDMIFAPAYGSSKKNATDIRLAVDAMELVFTRPEIGTYILLSGDSDFSSLVLKLKEYGKYVIGVGIRESSSDLLVMNCDEYYSYNALAGLVKTNEEEAVARDPWELVTEAISRMQRNGDVMRSDRLKQVMQEIDASFDESDLGFSKFSKFTMEAAQKGLLNVSRLENGQLEVSPAAPRIAAAAPAPAPAAGGRGAGRGQGRHAAPAPVAAPAGDGVAPPAVAADGEEDRPGRPRRGRRGRGGRGREGREERPSGEVAAQADREAADITPVLVPVSHVPAAAELIGESGERLTRDEAFQLVRQAVESLTRDEDDAARASEVRVRARELLGRDSESLGERMFTRILRDAHDADMIDLRRRGDDFEVARAVAAPSVREQLVRAESAATSPATTGTALSTAAAARRGMGPRSAPGRGVRGRPGLAGPPPDLFAVGVIEEPAMIPYPAPAAIEAEPEQAATVEEPAAAAPRVRGTARRGARKAPAAAVEPPVAASNGAEASPPAAKKAKRGGAVRKTGAKRAAKPKAAE
ncbi:MAG TPA: NYN domain-containing protein [Gemmatimonadaceae bacterium]|nr:NYN domain-containing protein [Gemmatimonadaceae bacterium]